MNPRQFFAKGKLHILFAGAFLLVLIINIIIDLSAGETLTGATLSSLGEIRPMEYIMCALMWYAVAVHKPKDDWNGSLTTLNLSQPQNQK